LVRVWFVVTVVDRCSVPPAARVAGDAEPLFIVTLSGTAVLVGVAVGGIGDDVAVADPAGPCDVGVDVGLPDEPGVTSSTTIEYGGSA